MQYRTLGKSGPKVSVLGFGCEHLPTLKPGEPAIDREAAINLLRKGIDNGINYIDTSILYHDGESEKVVGMALKDDYREKVYLATKCSFHLEDFTKTEDFDRYLNIQLSTLDVDYVDYYLFHSLNEKKFNEKVLALNLIDRMKAAKDAGKIRHIAFSFHDKPEVAKKIISTNVFDLMMVQYNIIDQVNEELIAYAAEKGLAVIIMGPVGAGRLAGPPPDSMQKWVSKDRDNFVDLAIKFVLSNPNVSVALSGMGSDEMLDDNLKLTSNPKYNVLEGNERERIHNIATKYEELTKQHCTSCKECMPCPNEVNIERIFNALIYSKIYGQKQTALTLYSNIGTKFNVPGKNATACIECGECLPKCPENISIIDQLKEAHEMLNKS